MVSNNKIRKRKISDKKENYELLIQDFFRFTSNKLVVVTIEQTEEEGVYFIEVKDRNSNDITFYRKFKIINKKVVDPKTNEPIKEIMTISSYLIGALEEKAKYFV